MKMKKYKKNPHVKGLYSNSIPTVCIVTKLFPRYLWGLWELNISYHMVRIAQLKCLLFQKSIDTNNLQQKSLLEKLNLAYKKVFEK